MAIAHYLMIGMNYFLEKDKWLRQGLLFRKALYVYLLLFSVQLCFSYDWLLSENAVYFIVSPSGYGLDTFLNLLSHPKFDQFSWLAILLLMISSFVGLIGWLPRITGIVIWFLTVNLNNRISLTTTGGELLLNNLLFFLIFFSDGKHPKNEGAKKYSYILDNFSVLACRTQLLVVYLFSALFKCLDYDWITGNALGIIFSIPDYSLPWARNSFGQMGFLLKMMTWITLLYQIAFPIFIWLKPYKKNLLILGVILHLGIAFTMGLFNFSLVMIIAYLLFL